MTSQSVQGDRPLSREKMGLAGKTPGGLPGGRDAWSVWKEEKGFSDEPR